MPTFCEYQNLSLLPKATNLAQVSYLLIHGTADGELLGIEDMCMRMCMLGCDAWMYMYLRRTNVLLV